LKKALTLPIEQLNYYCYFIWVFKEAGIEFSDMNNIITFKKTTSGYRGIRGIVPEGPLLTLIRLAGYPYP
jgi:hypothetical protein